jgi:UDPglucose 6-dehydrogenase
MSERIGFAGMTHLGLNSAVATAARGFDVVGFDANVGLVADLQARRLPIVEPDLDALVAEHGTRLHFSSDVAALTDCDVVYIATDVPTDSEGRSDLAPIRELIARITPNLRADAILVILCQVPPGFTRSISGIAADRVIYQVETLIFGRAVERALHPERFIIGCADPSRALPAPYQTLLQAFNCPILPMRYESAELAKISINFCLVASVCVANTLAEVSEAIGADWSEIVPALKLDRRIGQFSYLNPGLGISGGNLERDLRTILDISAAKKTDGGIVEAWLENSRYRKDWCWRVLNERMLSRQPHATVAVLGLAYKEDTHSTKNSPALMLLDHLKGADVRVHDPVVSASVVPFAKGCDTALAAADGANALVLATPWAEYRSLALSDLARVMRGRLLIDPYRMLDAGAAVASGFEYHALGRPPAMPS